MGIKLKTNNGNVDLTSPIAMLKGDPGGYYKPSIDAEGNLTWIASEEEMPVVEGASIVGPKGEDGKQGEPGAAFTYDMFTEEQLAALVGPKGDIGPKGDTGEKGETGAQGIQGEKGEQGIPGVNGVDGESGVYVGTEEPTDPEMLIWINPEGTATSNLATKEYVDEAVKNASGASVDLTNYYTKTEVDNKIPDVSKFQTEEQVNALINSALEEVENGTY